jgi:hypothetical protein
MKALLVFAWLLVVAAAAGFVLAVIVKLTGGGPVVFGLYPRSFMSFTNTCLLFAVVFLLLRIPTKKK